MKNIDGVVWMSVFPDNLFEISYNAANLMSFMIGMTLGLFLDLGYKRKSTYLVVGYFVIVAIYYAKIQQHAEFIKYLFNSQH